MRPIAGQLFDVCTVQEMNSWVAEMRKLPPLTILNNDCQGVDEKNLYNFWFQKTVFKRIQDLFDSDLHSIFGMLLNEKTPWGIHTDAYHVQDSADRESAMSFLFPYSVDNNKQLVDQTRTIVFNESMSYNSESELLALEDKTAQADSASLIHDQYLSHNSPAITNKLTVNGVYQWQHNSLIYWNSRNLHDSDNFLKNGYKSKQAIVIHTYRRSKSNELDD